MKGSVPPGGNVRNRPAWKFDNMESSGIAVLGIGVIAGLFGILGALIPHDLALDVPAMGAYSTIFVIVGTSMLMKGEEG